MHKSVVIYKYIYILGDVMIEFEKITDSILRLKVPFEDIYTAVFLIFGEGGAILVDAAACEYDAKEVILPALKKCIDLSEIKYLVCTHLHGDHGGGIRHLLPHLENAKVGAISERAVTLYGEDKVQILHDGDTLCGVTALSLFGHSLDCVGLYDARSKALIMGDAVQLYGITKYGCGAGFPKEYRKTIEKIRKLGAKMIVASHEYYPLGSTACKEEVSTYLDVAKKAFDEVEAFVKSSAETDPVKIAAAFTAERRKTEPDMPALQAYTVKALLNE